MLGSLPPIVPRDAFSLWSPVAPLLSQETNTSSQNTTNNNPQQQQQQQQQQQRRSNAGAAQSTLHARLRLEEEALYSRETNVQRFGSTWLRPPGVTKTYQAMMDEELERVEAHLLATREAERREMEAAAEEEARAAMTGQGDDTNAAPGDDMEGMERDLDEDVPEAEAHGSMDLDEGEDDAFVEQDADGDFDGDHDLDDDVPEAGSYQHTDTEVEDMSSDDERSSPRHPEQEAEEHVTPASGQQAVAAVDHGPQVIQNFQVPLPMPPSTPSISFNTPSEPADSSMAMSSPIAARPAARGMQMGTPTGAGRRSVRYANRRGENRSSG